MVETIMKRDGRTVEFKQEKIAEAVERAFQACGAMQDRAAAEDIAQRVVDKLESGAIEGAPTVEGVQASWRRRSSSPASCRRPSPTSCTAPSAAARAT
ncbi:MAG: ATP cone domain-containing protein [Eggerthella lenta]